MRQPYEAISQSRGSFGRTQINGENISFHTFAGYRFDSRQLVTFRKVDGDAQINAFALGIAIQIYFHKKRVELPMKVNYFNEKSTAEVTLAQLRTRPDSQFHDSEWG